MPVQAVPFQLTASGTIPVEVLEGVTEFGNMSVTAFSVLPTVMSFWPGRPLKVRLPYSVATSPVAVSVTEIQLASENPMLKMPWNVSVYWPSTCCRSVASMALKAPAPFCAIYAVAALLSARKPERTLLWS